MILHYPVKSIDISQPFGFDNSSHPLRKNFYLVFDHKHSGVDFRVPVGTTINASCPGIVVRDEYHEGMGNVVGTRYGNIVILYAHLSKPLVKLGQKVKIGDLIGLSGDTGKHCTHAHLHFEIRDITKSSLREMVFNPPFNNIIKELKNIFTYKVNNTNTIKTFEFLSIRYFGNKKYSKKISNLNKHLEIGLKERMPEGAIVKIPNY